MKHLSSLLLLVIISTNCFAQNRPAHKDAFSFLKNRTKASFSTEHPPVFTSPTTNYSAAKTNTLMLQCDSVASVYETGATSRRIFSYNVPQHTATCELLFKNPVSGSNWEKLEKYTVTMNSNDDIVLVITDTWNTTSNQYVPDTKEEYTYNNAHEITLNINYNWDSNANLWQNSDKTENTYTTFGKISTTQEYIWNNNQWTPATSGAAKTVYTYNGNNVLTQINTYYWDSSTSQWKDDRKNELVYGTNGYLTTNTQYWIGTGGQFVFFQKHEYTYDNMGNQLTDIHYSWNSSLNVWKEESKEELTYNANNQIAVAYYYGGFTSGTWKLYYRTDVQYDANGNEISFKDYSWDSVNNLWLANDYKGDLTYNTNYTNNDIYMRPLLKYLFDYLTFDKSNGNALLDFGIYYLDNNVWQTEEHQVFYYSLQNITTIASSTPLQLIDLFPNPAHDQVLLNAPFDSFDLEIWDVQGNSVLHTTCQKSDPISLATLAKGLYICGVSVKNQSYKLKLIVE